MDTQNKTPVSVQRCHTYRPPDLDSALERLLAPLGGIEAYVQPGQRVLLKPNWVAARPVEYACNTHPELLKAVTRLVRRAGGEAMIGDSPGIGSVQKVAEKLSLLDWLRTENVPLIEFNAAVARESTHGHCQLKLANEALDADVLINLPKLKTHQQLVMTGAVKNLFGCVKGRHKAWLHYAMGHREDDFAAMLIDNMLALKPALTIMDGVTGLQRGGPINGEPVELGLLLAGTDCVAIDRVMYEICGVDPQLVFVHRAAERIGAGVHQLEQIDILGEPLSGIGLPPIILPPVLIPISFSLRHILRGLWRQFRHFWLHI
ncbi:DUF362 domain-containing protein [Candidatus Sumerlaeota bacterium]|nr:DUF362 domain-containing protein [Candidatus Sumerlaeota bacterium]